MRYVYKQIRKRNTENNTKSSTYNTYKDFEK